MKRTTTIIVALLTLVATAFGQKADSITIEGRVVNTSGIPIKDAVVKAKKTGTIITTGVDGLFTMRFPIEGDDVIVAKEGLATFNFFFPYNCNIAVVLGPENSTWIYKYDYIKQMEPTAKTYYEAGQKFLNGDADNAPDLMKAYACFFRAANMEHSAAYYQLGKIYDEGIGVTQDYAAAIKWYKKTGEAQAKTRLGIMYLEGTGVKPDTLVANSYFLSAAARGDSVVARKYLEEIKKNPPSYKGTAEDRVFEVVEENAEFPGGQQACMEWLRNNIKYPKKAQEKGIQGKVFVGFVVNKDGRIVDVEVLRSPDEALSLEAVRVVKSMPRWKPAIQGNKVVRSRFSIPIYFGLH